MSEKQKRKPGRPPKPEGERKSRNFTFRSRGLLDTQLKEAAQKSGRSVSEEIEFRLERSFANDRIAGEPWNLDMARQLALLASLIETRTGKRWSTDSETRQELLDAFSELIAPTRWVSGEPTGRLMARVVRGENVPVLTPDEWRNYQWEESDNMDDGEPR